jgi:hypothetical protein
MATNGNGQHNQITDDREVLVHVTLCLVAQLERTGAELALARLELVQRDNEFQRAASVVLGIMANLPGDDALEAMAAVIGVFGGLLGDEAMEIVLREMGVSDGNIHD